MEWCWQLCFNFLVNSAANYSLLSKITLSSNLYNFHTLSLNNLANPSTNISSVITTRYAILDNLLYTTKIAFFSAINNNLVIKFTIKHVYNFSSTSFAINFSAGTSVLFFIIWYKLHLFTYLPTFFIISNYQ